MRRDGLLSTRREFSVYGMSVLHYKHAALALVSDGADYGSRCPLLRGSVTLLIGRKMFY